VFNVEGGCYAKVIRLSPAGEPEIYETTRRFGTVLENVVYDPHTRRLDLDDDSLTEKPRSSYPLTQLSKVDLGGQDLGSSGADQPRVAPLPRASLENRLSLDPAGRPGAQGCGHHLLCPHPRLKRTRSPRTPSSGCGWSAYTGILSTEIHSIKQKDADPTRGYGAVTCFRGRPASREVPV
jgi:hypothetical protein